MSADESKKLATTVRLQVRRKDIDRAFAAMGEDPRYLKEARRLAAEFEASDWEALNLVEKADLCW